MRADSIFYVYAHRRQSDGQLFYIGKGKGRRAWGKSGRNRRWKHIEQKHGFSVEVVASDMPEPCALTLERVVIAANRHSDLANYVDGGGGTSGWRHSEEAKAKIGAHWKGRKVTSAMREALLEANSNRVFSTETRAKMRTAAKSRPRQKHSQETRDKIAKSHLGLRPSAASRRKMSIAKIGKCSGRDNPTYDHTIRTFEHPEHGVFCGTRGDFIAAYDLPNGCVSATISGRQKSVRGWRPV